jgi:tetratricopeptide (TPR) repeat protein
MNFRLMERSRGSASSASLQGFKLFSLLLGVGWTLLSLWGTGMVGAAQEPLSETGRSTAVVEPEKKESGIKIWQAHREFLQKSVWDKSQNELEKLYQWKLNQGIRNHYYYAIALIRECDQLPKDAGEDVGSTLLRYAEKMAPDFSGTYYAQAAQLWTQPSVSFVNWTKAAWYWLLGVYCSYANLEESLPHYANFVYWLILGFLIALSAFSVSLALRYHAFFSHHVQHFVRFETSGPVRAILGGLLLLLPFALGIGWLGLFLIWLLVFWTYGTRADRTVTLALLVLMLVLPSAVRISSSFVASLTDSGVGEIIRANNGVWSNDLHRQLLFLQQRNPEDRDLLHAASLVEKRMGKYSEAEQHLHRWIELEPKAAAAYNNLGNVYLATNRVDQAVGAYQKAIQLDSARTESYYNLGQAYLLNLLLSEAESEFRRAKEMRPQLISFYAGISSKNPNRIAIDLTLDPVHMWRRVLGETPQQETLSARFWTLLGGLFPSKFEEIYGAGFLVLLGLGHWGIRRKPLIRRCERCGRLICSRCSRSLVIGNQCSQCVKAFSKSPSGDPQLMKDKRLEVAKYQLRQHNRSRWLSLALPGAGHLHRGHTKEGFLYFFLVALYLVKAGFWSGWVPDALDMEISFSTPGIVIAFFLAVGFYVWVQLRMLQILRREAKFYFRATE